jgi:hypothetical protein
MRSALAIVFVTACRATLPVPGAPDVLITLERQSCFGTCPVYTLAVYDDGRFLYHGDQFVKIKGDVSGFLTLSQVKRLERAFDDAGYFALADEYAEESFTDMPTAITSYRHGRDVKTIRHYYGDDTAPSSLSKLEHEIDEIAQTDRWVGTPKERDELRVQWQ